VWGFPVSTSRQKCVVY